MALEHHLHRLRRKPDHIKKHIAFWTSLSITLVIVLFWAASATLSQKAAAVAVQAESPWHAMSASAGDAWTSVKGLFGASTAVYQPQLQVSPGK
jgi:hypothetical protein